MKQTVEVAGCDYEIKNVPTIPCETHDVDGEVDVRQKVILLANDSPVSKEAILLHEIIHATFAQSGLTHLMSVELEEAIATAIEETLWNAGYTRVQNNDRHTTSKAY